jgi:hypothetical protein
MPSKDQIQLLRGTLDLTVSRTLATMGSQHAYQIATRFQREAKYSEITKAGQKALGAETQKWRTMAALVDRLLLGES